jgi:hypothetical protein
MRWTQTTSPLEDHLSRTQKVTRMWTRGRKRRKRRKRRR